MTIYTACQLQKKMIRTAVAIGSSNHDSKRRAKKVG